MLGCELHDDCLTCPYTQCKYEGRRTPRKPMSERLQAARDTIHLPVLEAAREMGVTIRYVRKLRALC